MLTKRKKKTLKGTKCTNELPVTKKKFLLQPGKGKKGNLEGGLQMYLKIHGNKVSSREARHT